MITDRFHCSLFVDFFCVSLFYTMSFFVSSIRRHTIGALVTVVQTCALPIYLTSVLTIPWELSRNSLMFVEAIGLAKLGHPQPDSNLSDDAKRGSLETMST